MSIDITVSFIIRLLLVFIFLRAVKHKITDYQHFSAQLQNYRLLPEPLVQAFAFLLIVVEGSLVFFLLIKDWLYPSFIAAAIFTVYALAMGISLVRGRDDLDCGCSGPYEFRQTISWALVTRNCVLAIFALATALPVTSRTFYTQDIGTVLLASIAVIFIYSSIEQSIANQQRQRQYFALKRSNNLDASP